MKSHASPVTPVQLLNELSLTRVPLTVHQYVLRLRCGEIEVSQRTDDNLGQLMSTVSHCFKAVQCAREGRSETVTTAMRRGTIWCQRMTMTALQTGWVLRLESGPYCYEAVMDRTLESVLTGFGGALKFFGLKYKVVTVEREVTRNREEAGRMGVWTPEDSARPAHEGGTA